MAINKEWTIQWSSYIADVRSLPLPLTLTSFPKLVLLLATKVVFCMWMVRLRYNSCAGSHFKTNEMTFHPIYQI